MALELIWPSKALHQTVSFSFAQYPPPPLHTSRRPHSINHSFFFCFAVFSRTHGAKAANPHLGRLRCDIPFLFLSFIFNSKCVIYRSVKGRGIYESSDGKPRVQKESEKFLGKRTPSPFTPLITGESSRQRTSSSPLSRIGAGTHTSNTTRHDVTEWMHVQEARTGKSWVMHRSCREPDRNIPSIYPLPRAVLVMLELG